MLKLYGTQLQNTNQYRKLEENNRFGGEEIYSKRVRAGKRRTYFFDVRSTKGNDYYLTITESKRRFDDDGYERHKIHLYKEDFNKFMTAFQDAMAHVKDELLPDYDFDEFSHEENDDDKIGNKTPENNESEESDSWE